MTFTATSFQARKKFIVILLKNLKGMNTLKNIRYLRVVEAHAAGFFRLLMKGIFDPYVL